LHRSSAHVSRSPEPGAILASPFEEPSSLTMTDLDAGAGAPEAGTAEPGIRILAQFIRDLSMENPRAPDALRPSQAQPQIDLNVEMNARGRDDGLFEVDLKLSARANRQDGPLFVVELLYGGVFQISGVPGEEMEPVLLIECPRYLFPFARRIIAEVTSEGGFPPFLLDPIDFAGVYAARKAQGAEPQVGHA
jgi:preprotein translocase subunit SecB